MRKDAPFLEALPSHPNWEMQQKRAKQLLRAAWTGDPDAAERIKTVHPHPPSLNAIKLADAQLVIARGYGFSSWVALKRKIDRLTKTPGEQFIEAVRTGDVARTRELLTAHSDVRERINEPVFSFDSPAVFQATRNLPLLDLLLEFGADLNARSHWWAGGFGILEGNLTVEEAKPLIERGAKVTVWAAAQLGLIEDLRRLLDAAPALVHARGGDGKQPLHYAATPEIVDLLVDRGANLNSRDIDHESTPLQYRVDVPEVARRLVERGADVDIFAAAALGDLARCKACLETDPACVTHRLGAPPWVTGKKAGGKIYNWTLGHELTVLEVARRRSRAVYDFLLETAPLKTRFLEAVWQGDTELARSVLDQNLNLPKELSEDDAQLPIRAAWWGNPHALRVSLELGFDSHVKNATQCTPLDRAAFHGYADIVELLLREDRDPPIEWKNQWDNTPLGMCIYGAIHGWKTQHPQDHTRTVELLVRAGAKINWEWIPTGHDAIDEFLRKQLPESRSTKL